MRFNQITTAILKEQQLAQAISEVRMAPSNLRQFVDSPAADGIQAGFEAEVVFPDALEDNDPYDEPDYDYDTGVSSIDDIDLFFDEAGLPDGYIRGIRAKVEKDYNKWLRKTLKERFDEDGPNNIAAYMIDHGSESLDFDPIQAVANYLKKEQYDDYEIDRIIDAAKNELEFATRKTKFKDNQEHAKWINMYEKATEELRDDLAYPGSVANEAADEGAGNKLYDEAFDQFTKDFVEDNDESELQREFLESGLGVEYMSQICDYYGFEWPYTNEGSDVSFDEGMAEYYADSLAESTGWKTVAYNEHGALRPEDTWVFEPDPSIEGNSSTDMGVEVISPPMPLKETIAKMKIFFAWLEEQNGYANESTGFHMSVSMPDHNPENVDFVKLALFLGDEHVLKEFGRVGNRYCRDAIKQLKTQGKKIDLDPVLEQMRNHLIQLASKSFAGSDGFGYKYNTINPKSKYIEFRGAGGDDYFADIEKIQNTLSRYAQALKIASEPDAYRNEYAKKFYKLIGSSMPEDINSIQLFSRYMAHEITAEQLKEKLFTLQQERNIQWYQVDVIGSVHNKLNILTNLYSSQWTRPVVVVAKSPQDAIYQAKKKMNDVSHGSVWNYKDDDEWMVRSLGLYQEGQKPPKMKPSAIKTMIDNIKKQAESGQGTRWKVSYDNNNIIVRAPTKMEAATVAHETGISSPFIDATEYTVEPLDGQEDSQKGREPTSAEWLRQEFPQGEAPAPSRNLWPFPQGGRP
jgi:Putative amidoligase enzyme